MTPDYLVWQVITTAGLFLLLFLIYLAPTIAAVIYRSNRKLLVFAINLLFGWTVFGWWGALLIARDSRSLDFRGIREPQYRRRYWH